MEFTSSIRVGSTLPYVYYEAAVKDEPMLFNCDRDTAEKFGGIITRDFLSALPSDWVNAQDLVIDSRVHMLMPGWFPCIPGYHHDDVPRTGPDGQPNYSTPEYRSEHVLMLVNAHVSPTEFALGTAEFDLPPQGEVVYKHWHNAVTAKLSAGELARFSAPDKTLVYFDDRSWHQGVPATQSGWRFFIRASRNTGRKPTNELRKQVQVYLSNPMAGW